MAAGTKDEPRDGAAGDRAWAPVPPPRSIPVLPNDRLGFAGSGLFGLGALLVTAPPKPESAELAPVVDLEPHSVESVAATIESAEAALPEQPEVLTEPPAVRHEQPVASLFLPVADTHAPEQAEAIAEAAAEASVTEHTEAEVPALLEADSEQPAEPVAAAPVEVADAAEDLSAPEAEVSRADPMPGLIADLNRRMHGIEQRLDITLLEIEQATRELRDAAKDQREASEMLRAMHLHQRAAPREEKPAAGGIRPASLAASDLVPAASMAKVAVADPVLTAPAPVETNPDSELAREWPLAPAVQDLPEAVAPSAGAAPAIVAPAVVAASLAEPTEPAPAELPASVAEPMPAEAKMPEPEVPAAAAQAVPTFRATQMMPAANDPLPAAEPGPARGLRWIVLGLIVIAALVWLLGPGRGYLAQAFDPRGWSATFGWAANGLDQAHVTLVEWSDAFRRMIRG